MSDQYKIKNYLNKQYFSLSKNPFLYHINYYEGKATCKFKGCNLERQMVFKEMCFHHGAYHDLLRSFLEADTNSTAKLVLSKFYPDSSQAKPPSKTVKQEKINVQSVPLSISLEKEMDSENVDDPSGHAEDSCGASPISAMATTRDMKIEQFKREDGARNRVVGIRTHICKLCGGKSKDSRQLNFQVRSFSKFRNISILPQAGGGLKDLKRHYANCMWEPDHVGKLLEFLPHYQGDHLQLGDSRGGPGKIDCFGNKWRYKCPFSGSFHVLTVPRH